MTDPVEAGQRIEQLLDALAVAGPVAKERAEELTRVLVDLYGAGLERILELLHDTGHLDDDVASALAGDPLVASLLLVHGLHPHAASQRINSTLAGSGFVVSRLDDGVLHLRAAESGAGCGRTRLDPDVELALLAAAPEVTEVRVQEAVAVIPVTDLMSRIGQDRTATA